MRSKTAVTTVLAFIAGMAAATEETDAPSRSHVCSEVDDPARRLACYDAAFPRSVEAHARGAAIARDKAKKEFGLGERGRPSRETGLDGNRLDSIEASVAEVAMRRTGERIVTLDNGQIWLQTEVTIRGPLQYGDRVVIRKAAFGSYMLVTPGGVALRVRRIK